LKGLNFVKGKNDPVALEDGEYPAWLWGILKKGKGGAEGAADAGSVEGDLFCTLYTLLPFPPLTLPSLLFLGIATNLSTSQQPNPKNNAA
jgi:hypothetical protein